MWDRDLFFKLLDEARAQRVSGDLAGSLDHYERALRMITPDDQPLTRIIDLQESGVPVRGVSEAPNTDRMDSHIRSEMVEVLRELHRFDDAHHHARIAYYLDGLVHGEAHNDTAASLLDLGLIEFQRNRLAEAEEWLRRSQEVDQALDPPDAEKWAVRWRTLVRAGMRAHWGYLADSADAVLKILPEIEGELAPYRVVQALNDGAQSLQNMGEHGRARELLEHAIEVQIDSSPEHPQLGRLYSNLAVLLHEQLDFSGSDDYVRKATRFGRFDPERARQESLPGALAEDRGHVEAWMRANRQHFATGGSPRPHDIFLSFNTRDEATVEALHDALEDLGLRTWWFKEQPDWSRPKTDLEIREGLFAAINDAHLVVMVGSGTSLTSQFVLDEVEHSISAGVPFLIWYPEGVRMRPEEASTRSATSPDHLLEMIRGLMRPGVGALYGYGLRDPDVREIAAAVRSRFAALVPGHPVSDRVQEDGEANVLCPTRLWPVLIDGDDRPMFPALVR